MDGERRDRLWQLVAERAGRRRDEGWAGVVCEVVVAQVDVDAAAISVRTSSSAQELVAASDDWARELEELQYTVGEGPGPEAFTGGGPVLVADLDAVRGRWPGFVDVGISAGMAAVFAFPLQGGAIRLGTLTLYRRRAAELTADGLSDAAALADLATTALLTDANEDAADAAPWARENSPGHYADVSVATGMLAAQLRIGVEDAFLRLRAHAFGHGLPLLDVARDVLHRRLRLDRPTD